MRGSDGAGLLPKLKPLAEEESPPWRKLLTETDPGLLRDLKKMLDDSIGGDPQSSLKWTSKSCQHLAA